jgi:hypothetical protein
MSGDRYDAGLLMLEYFSQQNGILVAIIVLDRT